MTQRKSREWVGVGETYDEGDWYPNRKVLAAIGSALVAFATALVVGDFEAAINVAGGAIVTVGTAYITRSRKR